jgi:hypothetical protein
MWVWQAFAGEMDPARRPGAAGSNSNAAPADKQVGTRGRGPVLIHGMNCYYR